MTIFSKLRSQVSLVKNKYTSTRMWGKEGGKQSPAALWCLNSFEMIQNWERTESPDAFDISHARPQLLLHFWKR